MTAQHNRIWEDVWLVGNFDGQLEIDGSRQRWLTSGGDLEDGQWMAARSDDRSDWRRTSWKTQRRRLPEVELAPRGSRWGGDHHDLQPPGGLQQGDYLRPTGGFQSRTSQRMRVGKVVAEIPDPAGASGGQYVSVERNQMLHDG